MAPLETIEFSAQTREELKFNEKRRKNKSCDSSLPSEISIDFLCRERENDRNNGSSSSGWNPDDSDYSLNVLLHSKDEEQYQSSSANVALNESLMGSKYSLDLSQYASRKTTPKEESETDERKSKVRFYHRVRIQRVTNRKHLSKEHSKKVWYSREEFKEIRNECFQTIKIMTDHEDIIEDEDEYCFRGLEYKTKEASKKRQRNKLEVRQAVLDEQEYQKENGMNDPEWISMLSIDESRTCKRDALERARQDEKEAFN